MKKSTKTTLLTVTCLLGAVSLAGCGEEPKPHEHVFSNYVSDNNATCTKNGTKTAKCEGCDETNTVEEQGSMKAHSFGSYVSNNDATCTADGTKTATCSACGAKDKVADPNSKKGHSFTNYQVTTPATCYQNEIKTAKCDNCDVTDTKETNNSATGVHSFTNYVSNNDATCTANGTEKAHCNTPGCTVTDTRTANNSKLAHVFENYVYNNDATCTQDGTETGKCKDCDATDTRTKAGTALGHDLVWHSNNDATCTEDGTKTGECSRCDYVSDPVADEGTAKGHTFSDEYYYDGDGHWHPSTCGHTGEKGDWAPHVFEEVVLVEPTCSKGGMMQRVCECGYSSASPLPAGDHKFENYVSDGNATCTQDGTKTSKCTYCDATKTIPDVGSATGHTYEDTYTYDENGHWYKCVNEDDTTGYEAHQFTETVTKEPTAQEEGEKTYTCICGYSYTAPISNEDLRFACKEHTAAHL